MYNVNNFRKFEVIFRAGYVPSYSEQCPTDVYKFTVMLVQVRTIIKFENGGTNLARYKSHSENDSNIDRATGCGLKGLLKQSKTRSGKELQWKTPTKDRQRKEGQTKSFRKDEKCNGSEGSYVMDMKRFDPKRRVNKVNIAGRSMDACNALDKWQSI
ncbi:hypothetical protein LXL04_013412 [Taraxacum kok-saghyz]